MKDKGYILPVSSIMKVRIEAKLATAVNYATSISVKKLVVFSVTPRSPRLSVHFYQTPLKTTDC